MAPVDRPERCEGGERCALHLGHGSYAVEEALVKLPAVFLLELTVPEVHGHDDPIGKIKSRINGQRVAQTPHEQARRGQEHQRKGDLGDHQTVLDA